MKTQSEYDIAIEVEPYQYISYIKIGGKQIDHMEADTCSLYFVWSTHNMYKTDSCYRLMCPFVLKLEHFPEVKFDMQMKFYDIKEVVHFTGKPLTGIDLKVEPRGNNTMHVSKIIYS